MYTFTVDWMINCTPWTPESFLYYEKLVNIKEKGRYYMQGAIIRGEHVLHTSAKAQ
jgi:hypothetical protein